MQKRERFLTLKEVCDLVKLGPTSIWEKERAGNFPRRLKPEGYRASVFVESEIFDWIEQRIQDTPRTELRRAG